MKRGKGTKGTKGLKGINNASQKRVIKQSSQSRDLPVNDTPSNTTGDKLSVALFFALFGSALAICGFGFYYSISRFSLALTTTPVDLWNCLFMTLVLAASLMVARMLYWLAFFGSVLLASRIGGWNSAETICRQAIKFAKLVPNGSGWAAVSLVQSLIGRGQFEEAIAVAEAEWERNGDNEKQAMNLGPMCVAAGMAHQATGDFKQASAWNDRGISALTKILEQAENKEAKGFFAKAARMQASQWTGQVKMQLAVAHFHSATFHFNSQDFRRAKENFKKSVDYANQSPDFPQKQDVIKMARDQLARLKHY